MKILSKETKFVSYCLNAHNIGTSLGHFVVPLSIYGLRTSCLPPPHGRSWIGDFEGGGYSIPDAFHGRGMVFLTCSSQCILACVSVSLGTVHDIVNRGGRCLIPVFALGRAQELLLILGMNIFLHYTEPWMTWNYNPIRN